MKKFDIVVIGAGVVGTAIARELSHCEGRIAVIEANADACMESSAANSGIVHAGYDCKPNTLKAKFNVRGCKLYPRLAQELDFPYKNTGSLVVATNSEQARVLEELLEKGRANGVEGLKILDREQSLQIEPCLSDEVIASLYAPTAGIVGPYEFGFACMENSIANGAEYFFDFRLASVQKKGCFVLTSSKGIEIAADRVINAAGVCADDVARLFGDSSFSIAGRRGEYILYDKTAFVRVPIFPVPSAVGKGILISPTVHGNIFVGPTGEDASDKLDKSTTAQGAEKLLSAAKHNVAPFNVRASITAFTGVRAISGEDFVVGFSSECEGLYNAAGICSPGLTSAPAIAEHVCSQMGLAKKAKIVKRREAIKNFADASDGERAKLLKRNAGYGNIICRCETISEAEIVEAVRRGATTVDGVKRRVRAGAGRCQGGFCLPKVAHIIARERGIELESVTKKGEGSQIVFGNVKEVEYEG